MQDEINTAARIHFQTELDAGVIEERGGSRQRRELRADLFERRNERGGRVHAGLYRKARFGAGPT